MPIQENPPKMTSIIRTRSWGVDSSCHVRTNVSVERDIIKDISVHKTYKGEELFFFSAYIQNGY